MPRLQVRISKEIENDLDEIAMQTRTSRSHIAREALIAYVDVHLHKCPECGGVEVKEHGEFDKGLCRAVTYLYCADCGAVWEV